MSSLTTFGAVGTIGNAPIASGIPAQDSATNDYIGVGTLYSCGLSSGSNSTSSYTSVVDFSGAGVVELVSIKAHASDAAWGKITIDGNVVYESSAGAGQTESPIGHLSSSTGPRTAVAFSQVPFKTSLKLELKATTGGYTAYMLYKYWRSA